MRKPLLALLFIVMPCAAPAVDMHVQLAGWRYATQNLDAYRVRTRSLPISHFEQRLAEINSEINAIPYRDVTGDYGETVWQTPVQLGQMGGQCRDYAVAKYHALYALGVADADMQFVGVRVLAGRYKGQFHALLLVRYMRHTYVLDNLHHEIRSGLIDYEPVYYINRLGWKVVQ